MLWRRSGSANETLGTLSLYAAQSAAFSEHDERIIELFATLAALALAEGAASRPTQAPPWSTAMLSARPKASSWSGYKMNPEAAFSTLTRISQARNIKACEIACRVVETGELPDTTAR